jgi:hypothetical protein
MVKWSILEEYNVCILSYNSFLPWRWKHSYSNTWPRVSLHGTISHVSTVCSSKRFSEFKRRHASPRYLWRLGHFCSEQRDYLQPFDSLVVQHWISERNRHKHIKRSTLSRGVHTQLRHIPPWVMSMVDSEMEGLASSETSVLTYDTTLCQDTED